MTRAQGERLRHGWRNAAPVPKLRCHIGRRIPERNDDSAVGSNSNTNACISFNALTRDEQWLYCEMSSVMSRLEIVVSKNQASSSSVSLMGLEPTVT
jgi:hypothetical protein